MRICMVQRHGCIRVLKEALALKSRGYTVELISQEAPFAYNSYETFNVYHDPEQLKRTVAASRADLFHVHNEPDWLVPVVREATDKPIVFDVHDLESLRWQREPDPVERLAFEAAAGFVHVSDECATAAERYHGNGKPVAILPCYINEEFYPPIDHVGAPSWSTVVYEGGLDITPRSDRDDQGRELLHFRGLESVVKAFVTQGFEFRLHPSLPREDLVYENLGAVVSQPLIFPTLLRALRSYGYGFVGAPHSTPLMEAALPNKLFEYLSQGVVPVVLNAARAARFVREHGLGIVLNGLSDLQRQLEPGPFIRRRVLERAREWTMDRHIGVIETLYSEVTGQKLRAAGVC